MPPLPITVSALLAVLANAPCSAQQPQSGHDGRAFVIRSAQNGDSLSIGGRAQFRYIANFGSEQDRSDGSSGEDFTSGFELARTWLDFNARTNGGNFSTRLVASFDRATGEAKIEYAYSDFRLNDHSTIRIGQDKGPFLREELVGFQFQQAVDRSVTNEVFSTKLSQGVWFVQQRDRLRWTTAITDGSRATTTTFYSPREADIALSGRAEVRLGDAPWRQFNDITSFRDGEFGVLLGGAVHWESRGNTAAFRQGQTAQVPVADRDIFAWTLDASIEGVGWNLLAQAVNRYTDAKGQPEYSDWGLLLQGGLFLTDQFEIFSRWDAVFPDSDRGSASDDFHTITIGGNYYFIPSSHALKFTTDVQIFLDDQPTSSSLVTAPNASAALLPGEDSGQVALRMQIQVLF